MRDNLKISIFDISVVRLLIDQGVVTVKQTEEGYEIVGRGMFLILKNYSPDDYIKYVEDPLLKEEDGILYWGSRRIPKTEDIGFSVNFKASQILKKNYKKIRFIDIKDSIEGKRKKETLRW